RRQLPLGTARVAASAHATCHGARAEGGTLHPVSWRHVPPVYSPIAVASLRDATLATFGVRRRSAIAEELRRRFEARELILTDSGTSALVIALRVAVPSNGVVAMPAYCCIDIIA